MRHNPGLLKVQPDIILNIDNIAYIELTAKGGLDILFVGKVKALYLNATQAESLRDLHFRRKCDRYKPSGVSMLQHSFHCAARD